jgi:hypothetical protein
MSQKSLLSTFIKPLDVRLQKENSRIEFWIRPRRFLAELEEADLTAVV